MQSLINYVDDTCPRYEYEAYCRWAEGHVRECNTEYIASEYALKRSLTAEVFVAAAIDRKTGRDPKVAMPLERRYFERRDEIARTGAVTDGGWDLEFTYRGKLCCLDVKLVQPSVLHHEWLSIRLPGGTAKLREGNADFIIPACLDDKRSRVILFEPINIANIFGSKYSEHLCILGVNRDLPHKVIRIVG